MYEERSWVKARQALDQQGWLELAITRRKVSKKQGTRTERKSFAATGGLGLWVRTPPEPRGPASLGGRGAAPQEGTAGYYRAIRSSGQTAPERFLQSGESSSNKRPRSLSR